MTAPTTMVSATTHARSVYIITSSCRWNRFDFGSIIGYDFRFFFYSFIFHVRSVLTDNNIITVPGPVSIITVAHLSTPTTARLHVRRVRLSLLFFFFFRVTEGQEVGIKTDI